MKTSLRLLSAFLVVAVALLAYPGCQTSKGFGKDVEKLGEKIQDKAK